jgi:hypothetical protein
VVRVLEQARHNLEIGLVPVAREEWTASSSSDLSPTDPAPPQHSPGHDIMMTLLRIAVVAAAAGMLMGCADTSIKSGPVTYSIPCSPALVRMGVAF